MPIVSALKKMFYLELSRSSNRYFKPLLDPGIVQYVAVSYLLLLLLLLLLLHKNRRMAVLVLELEMAVTKPFRK